MYTITELSNMFKLPPSTLRYYEKIGLLENVVHVNGYHRQYDEKHAERLRSIECFKRALLTLNEIHSFYELEKDMSNNAEKIIEIMKKKELNAEKAIKDMEDGLAHLKQKIHFYSMVKEAADKGREAPKWEEVFPDHGDKEADMS